MWYLLLTSNVINHMVLKQIIMCIISILSMLYKSEELWNRIVVGNSDSSTESFIVRFMVKISRNKPTYFGVNVYSYRNYCSELYILFKRLLSIYSKLFWEQKMMTVNQTAVVSLFYNSGIDHTVHTSLTSQCLFTDEREC